MNQTLNIKESIASLKTSIRNADNKFDKYIMSDDDWDNPNWDFETCFLKLLTIAEAMGLMELHKMILSEYLEGKNSKSGFVRVGEMPDVEPYSEDASRLRQLLHAIEQFYPTEDSTTVTKDLLQILRDVHYTITDKKLFIKVPQNEQDVHVRIEGILRCIFPDLKHKPTLTKPIKNFEPDTGIPSIETLIEYKFLSSPDDDKTIADQVLADTRGYTSKDWKNFIYVIYETNRFRREKEWVQLLRDSGVPDNTNIIVLSGEPAKKRKKKTPVKLNKK